MLSSVVIYRLLPTSRSMPRHLSVRLFLVLGCLLGFSDLVAAQEIGRVEQVESNTQPYYFFLRPGEATTQLYVWGNVRAPGLYEVGSETRLDQVLSLAGGPLVTAIQAPGSQTVTVRIYRAESGSRALAYEAELEQMVQEPSAYPVLQDGDLVYVETKNRQGFSLRDALTILGSAAAILVAVDRVFFDQ